MVQADTRLADRCPSVLDGSRNQVHVPTPCSVVKRLAMQSAIGAAWDAETRDAALVRSSDCSPSGRRQTGSLTCTLWVRLKTEIRRDSPYPRHHVALPAATVSRCPFGRLVAELDDKSRLLGALYASRTRVASAVQNERRGEAVREFPKTGLRRGRLTRWLSPVSPKALIQNSHSREEPARGAPSDASAKNRSFTRRFTVLSRILRVPDGSDLMNNVRTGPGAR